jgi:hypothetical protein
MLKSVELPSLSLLDKFISPNASLFPYVKNEGDNQMSILDCREDEVG